MSEQPEMPEAVRDEMRDEAIDALEKENEVLRSKLEDALADGVDLERCLLLHQERVEDHRMTIAWLKGKIREFETAR